MRQSGIAFKSKGLTLEGAITLPESRGVTFPGVVVCHPHPLFGGDMENSVVVAICRTLGQYNIASLRFNFRGVSNSEGTFSNGDEEQEDVRSALYVLKKWPGINGRKIGLAGYSFGASVILRGISKTNGAKAFALIAPPVSAVKGSAIAEDKRRSLLIAGENDKIAPAAVLKEVSEKEGGHLEFRVLPKADHSLGGHEMEAGRLVAGFFSKVLR